MSNTATIDQLQQRAVAPREASLPSVAPGFGSLQSFELMQRQARLLSASTLVPSAYQAQTPVKEYGKVVRWEENPSALPNCIIALNMANRLGSDVLMVMQNLYIVEGRPSWSSQYIAAAINASGRFTPLRYELSEPGEAVDVPYIETNWEGKGDNRKKVETTKTVRVQHRTCFAWALDKATGDKIVGPKVSIQMAIDEGWLTKKGSKWQTMPEVMLHYRATSFFGKLHAPDLLMGLQTREELEDIIDARPGPDGKFSVDLASLKPEPPAKETTKAEPDKVIEAEVVDPANDNQPDAAPAAAEPQPQAKPERKQRPPINAD